MFPESLGGASFFGGEGRADVVRLPMCFLHEVPLGSSMQREAMKSAETSGDMLCHLKRVWWWRYSMRKVPQVPCQLTSHGNLGKSFHSLWALFLLWPKGLILIIPLALQREIMKTESNEIKFGKFFERLKVTFKCDCCYSGFQEVEE